MGWDATCPTLSTQLGLVRAGVVHSWMPKVDSNFSTSFAIGSRWFYGAFAVGLACPLFEKVSQTDPDW